MLYFCNSPTQIPLTARLPASDSRAYACLAIPLQPSSLIKMYITTTRHLGPDRILVYLFDSRVFQSQNHDLFHSLSGLLALSPFVKQPPASSEVTMKTVIPDHICSCKTRCDVCVLYHSYTPTGFQSSSCPYQCSAQSTHPSSFPTHRPAPPNLYPILPTSS